ncbi:serine protease inhibitor 42Dd [Drosophila nasuta]|uniref:serine protease inhibitor 42Dd n=1 Tax=Drosophila nasuta TaxID=42062 RepID=UPI00295EADDE|nr:serine protease inhibitor 42Dd [Drosophila nasuta]
MASGGTIKPPPHSSICFARNLFQALSKSPELSAKNHMVSPAAARSALTLVFMGAGVKSAEELRRGLLLGSAKKVEIAEQHAEVMSKECVCNEKGVSMRLATGLFVKDDLELLPDFNAKALEFFNVQADTLNFLDAQSAMQHVNKWIASQTFHTIRNPFSPATFSVESSVLLVNSVYFRARWAKRFAVEHSTLDDFWINPKQRMQLTMMRQVGKFRYGQSNKLKSRILQLPFEESDLTMLLIVPFEIDGLPELEMKLQQFDLNEVALKSVMHDCEVMMPRFKMECDVDLKVPMQKLGIKRIFEPGNADLSGLFAKKSQGLITEARQKLYLNVNEAGCETNSDAPVKPAAVGKDVELKIFKANHPFVFAIRNNRNVYFVGHFVKP